MLPGTALLLAAALAPAAPGFDRLAGSAPVAGTGEPLTYAIDVERALDLDPARVTAEVDAVLADPRGWTRSGRVAFRRVDRDPAMRIVVARPATTDRLCAPLDTNGYFSCGTGGRAVLNVARWLTGADAYPGPLPAYRQYLVNHEVGHLFGRGHESCPGPGQPAPVMMQQTKGLDGCTPVSWPYP